MCLILFAYRQHPRYRLIVAANRDEFYARPTASAAYWPEHPQLLAGKDLQQGGTWLGTTLNGRFAALTNVRLGFPAPDASLRSRGELPTRFLTTEISSQGFHADLQQQGPYARFNLLVDDGDNLGIICSRGQRPTNEAQPNFTALAPGIYGLSNAGLNTPWPKVQRGRSGLRAALQSPQIDSYRLLDLLTDDRHADDALLPETGVGLEWERRLSPLFIRSESYGTRASTVFVQDYSGGWEFIEQGFDTQGKTTTTRFTGVYSLKPGA